MIALLPHELKSGLSASFEAEMGPDTIQSFSKFSGDWNPLHNDIAYAQGLGLKSRVAHGAIQQALISRMLGMYLPGKYCVIKSVHTHYAAMALEGEKLKVTGTVQSWDAPNLSGNIRIDIESIEGQSKSVSMVAFGLIGVESKSPTASHVKTEAATSSDTLKRIFLIGKESGLGKALTPRLETNGFTVYGSSRKNSNNCLAVDLESSDLTPLCHYLHEHKVFGVVHLATLPPLKCSPSKLNTDALLRNIRLHIEPLRKIAELIQQGKLTSIKRLILIGSTWASHLMPEKGYEGYAYTKMVASYFAKDLAREMAKYGVTVNLISPSEMHVGMNAAMSPTACELTAVKNPSNRLTTAEDVENTLSFLLSDNASCVTGQEVVLSGGRRT